MGGIFHAACYARTRTLWVPVGFHFAWNTTMGVVFGLPVSGAQIPGLLRAEASGSPLWTGGAFGPEASVSAAAFVVCAAAFYVWRDAAEGRLVTPAWLRRLAQRSTRAPLEPG